MIHLGGLKGIKEIWGIYLFIILVIFLVVRGWNVYNYFKFRKTDRRQESPVVTAVELEGYLKFEAGGVATIQNWSNVVIDFADHYSLKLRDQSGKTTKAFTAKFNPSAVAPHPNPKKNGNGSH